MSEYNGVEHPAEWPTWTSVQQAAWEDGVDAARDKAGDRDAVLDAFVVHTQAAPVVTDLVPSREVSAFAAVTEDRTQAARDIVRDMSGRDRAVLSFWIRELQDIVSQEEDNRRFT